MSSGMNKSPRKYDPAHFVVRDYEESDWTAVQNLWLLTGLAAPERADGPHEIKETLHLGGKLIILEFVPEKKIAGTSWITNDGRRLHLHHMAVIPEMQGNGLSHLLMRASLHYAAQLNRQIKLEVHEKNITARNLYKKWGFAPLGDYDVLIIRNPRDVLLPPGKDLETV